MPKTVFLVCDECGYWERTHPNKEDFSCPRCMVNKLKPRGTMRRENND